MQATLASADVTYEVFFKKPLFDARDNAPLIQSVYDALSGSFLLSINDITVNQGPAPSQISVALSMFAGAGSIELRVDRWRGSFRRLVSSGDFDLILRCLNVTSGAMQNTSDRLSPARAKVVVASWYNCDMDLKEIEALLGRYWLKDRELHSNFLNAEQVTLTLNPYLKNATEGWDVFFLVQPSAVPGTQLFLNYTGTYIIGGRYNSIDQQSEHVRGMIEGMLKELGFEVPQH
jgi:hypothetical protein